MKRKSVIMVAVSVALLCSSFANAQELKHAPADSLRSPHAQGEKMPPREMPSVEEMAQQKADLMNKELGLDEKQYKKVLKYYKSEIEGERSLMEAGKPSGKPEGFPGGGPGMGGGRPPMGGGPGMGGGMPPMGGGHGMSGFGGPQGGFSGGDANMQGGMPPKGAGPSDEELDEFYQKQDKKLKKILTNEQYSAWRAKHPVQTAPMPEPEWVE